MGKKQRRTKWRRLSLGDASGPEEEDDETTQQQQQQEQQQQQQEPVESHSETTNEPANASTTTSEIEKHEKDALRVSSPTSSTTSSGRIEMPGEQHQQARPWSKPGAKQAPSGGAYCPSSTVASRPGNSFRRPRYSNNNGVGNGQNGGSYGRANSWNSYDCHGKTHGIEKKIFNDEEYTKISTPRQEVLFKKGSIGAKKRPTTTAAAPAGVNDSGSEHDSGNASTSPTSPGALNGDAESFHYSGNDNGSTGDASSTAGDAAGSEGSALAAGYDGTAPLVCFPMYDFYGAYPGMYPGGMLVQTYPGGPLVPAVPVPVPVQAVDWYGRGSASTASTSTTGNSPPAEMPGAFYYALGYPAAAPADVSVPLETGSNSRRNSLESCQASSAEASEGSPSENGSSGPSSQGPASPQSEPANGSPEKPGQNGASSTVAAAAATVMDMAMEQRKQQQQQQLPVAGFLYPYAAYGLAPPLYADPVTGAFYYDEYGYPYDYEAAYDVEANNEEVVEDQGSEKQLDPLNEPKTVAETVDKKPSPAAVRTNEAPSKRKTDKSTDAKKKKKKKKKRNKQAAKLTNDKAPVTDEPTVEDEEDEDEDEEVASVAARQTTSEPSSPSSNASEVNSSPEPSEPHAVAELAAAVEQLVEAIEAVDLAKDDEENVQEQAEVVVDEPTAEEPEMEPVQPEATDVEVPQDPESFRDSFANEAAAVVEDIVKAYQNEQEHTVEEHQAVWDAATKRDSGLIDSPLVSALEKIIAELVDAQLPSCRNDPSPEPPLEAAADDFVHLPEKDLDDEYFEDELSGIGGNDDPPPPLPSQPPPQLWQTIVLNEEDTFQRKDDVYDLAPVEERSDSGIGKDLPSPTTSVGPITKAVSLWLETDAEAKLIQSTADLELDDVSEEEEDDEEQVVQVTTGPKNVQGTLRCAASSDEQRRVDEDEPEASAPIAPQCHPAKYSVYYQLGVSVDENDNGDEKQQQQQLDETMRSTLPLTSSSKKKLRSSKKRLSWHRRSRDNDDSKHKRLKPARSCCAVQ